MSEFLIEQWIYRYAVRSGFSRILNENEQLFRKYSIPDLDIVVSVLKDIVEHDRFERYDLARQLISALNNNNSSAGGAEVFENEADFGRLIFLLKFVHILKLIGNYSVSHVTQLMNEYFGGFTNDESAGKGDFDSQKLQTSLIDASFTECRKFVLNLLIRQDRQVHFRTHKFPDNFYHVIYEIKRTVLRLVEKLCEKLTPCELERYSKGEITIIDDPSVALFHEYFKPGEKLNENSLADFLKNLACSQISVSPPKFVEKVKTSNSAAVKNATAKKSVGRKRKRNSSESLKSRVTTISSNDHYRAAAISTSFPGCTTSTKEKDNGSDLLFPSLDALISQRAESRLSKTSVSAPVTKPCTVNLLRISEDEIQKTLTKKIKT